MISSLFKRQKAHVSSTWRVALVTIFLVMLVLNGLAGSTTLLGGQNTANVSDSYPNLFAPAGLTFAIWGVIYTLLVGFCLYVWGVGRSKKSVLKAVQLEKITKLMTLNFAANAAWILAWQYEVLWLSVLLITTILVTLILVVQVLRDIELPAKEYALARLPVSVYLGWISIATVANITVFLVSIQWNGWGVAESAWTIFVLIFATLVGFVTAQRNNDIAYLLVFVWAFFGILFKHVSPTGYDGQYQSVIIALTILLAVLASQILSLVSPFVAKRR